MSSIYARGGRSPGARQTLWVAFQDANGIRRCRSTGYRFTKSSTPEERELAYVQAKAVLKEIQDQVAAERDRAANGPLTLARYAGRWVAGRKARRLATARDDEARLRDHVLPALGSKLLEEVSVRDVRGVFRALMAAGRLAPRTVLHVYFSLNKLMEDAVADELRPANPCVLRADRGELPEKVDKDPLWRAGAVYSLAEARQLCTSELVDPWRRVLYTMLFFTCLRIGELLGRRWRDYDRDRQPLGALLVASAWNTKERAEGPTKTRRPREVPVHPELARVLAEWRLTGWRAFAGRPPTEGDWIIPPHRVPSAPQGAHGAGRPRSSKSVLKAFHADCLRLGYRPRRTHDTRRSWISWARAAPETKDSILKWVSHGPGRKTVLDAYTEHPWPQLCEQVMALPLSLGPGQLVLLGEVP